MRFNPETQRYERTPEERLKQLATGWKLCECGRVFWFPAGPRCVECGSTPKQQEK